MRTKKTILVLERDHQTLKRLSLETRLSMLALVQEAISLLEERYTIKQTKETIEHVRQKEPA